MRLDSAGAYEPLDEERARATAAAMALLLGLDDLAYEFLTGDRVRPGAGPQRAKPAPRQPWQEEAAA